MAKEYDYTKVLNWIFYDDDGYSANQKYGLMGGPYRKRLDVSKKLQELRSQDKRIDSFVKTYKINTGDPLDFVQPEIDKENLEWVGKFQEYIESGRDNEFIAQKWNEEQSIYETLTGEGVGRLLKGAVVSEKAKKIEEDAEKFKREKKELYDKIKQAKGFVDIGMSSREIISKFGKAEGRSIIKEIDDKNAQFESLAERTKRELQEKIKSAKSEDYSRLRDEIIRQTQLESDESQLLRELEGIKNVT